MFLKSFLVVVSIAAWAGPARAEATSAFSLNEKFPPDGKNELTVSNTQGVIVAGSDVTSLGLELDYLRYQGNALVFGVDAAFSHISFDDESYSAIALFGVMHYLFEPVSYTSGFFGLAAVGIGNAGVRVGPSNGDDAELGFRLGAGRRFVLMRGLYLRPELYIEKIGELDPSLVFEFIKLSFIW